MNSACCSDGGIRNEREPGPLESDKRANAGRLEGTNGVEGRGRWAAAFATEGSEGERWRERGAVSIVADDEDGGNGEETTKPG